MASETSAVWLSVVVPAYNEGRRIGATLQSLELFLSRQNYASEVVVADDGSTDETPAIVEVFAREFPRVRCVEIPHAGKGAAVRAGMLAARGEWRYLCDADLSTPPEEIAHFLPPESGGADVVIGSREVSGARRIGEPWRRHVMGRVFNRVVRALAVSGISDTQCGFKAFHAEAAEQLFRLQRLSGFGFDVEVLALARRIGFKVREIPVSWYWQPGSKVQAVRDTWRMLQDVLAVRRGLRRGIYGELPVLDRAEGPLLVPLARRDAPAPERASAQRSETEKPTRRG